MAGTGNDSAFQRALARFKGHLSPEQQEDFAVTSLKDVQEMIARIQDAQGSERRMRNLTRIKGFVEAMEQYGKVIEIFLNVSEIIAFIWGPVKFLLQVASTWVESFDVLLDAYEEISENLPQLLEYGELFKRHAHMRKILELMYGDILEFHRRALKFFSRPTWKQLFRSSWKTFRTQFQYILSSLSRHKHLVESQASLLEYEQSRVARLNSQNSFEDIAKAERSRRFLAVTEKIRPPNTLTNHEGTTEIREEYPESGRWILQHPFLKDWKDFTCPKCHPTTVLWINGIPGAGKTVIASLIIEEMKAIDSVNVCFFYCKYSDNHKKSFTDILRGILVQLVQQNEELLSYIYDACCSSSELTMDSPKRLKDLVETSLRSCSNTCVIVDGIDECDEVEEKKTIAWFLATFENITRDNAGTIRLLFVSQRNKVTESLLAQALVIPLDSKYHQEDIQKYAHHWSVKIQRKFGIPHSSAIQIGASVAAQAEGLFLFARLVLSHLYSQTTRQKLFAEIRPESFPTGLDAAYERIVLRIFENPNESEREDAHNIFRWIICAKRPLRWSDVQSIFAIDPELQKFDFEERQLQVTCRDLCGSLVETGVGDRLELVHRSARLYLIKTGRISVRTEDLHIAELCLHYLNFGCFDADLAMLDISEFFQQGYYSFEDYAIAHWLDHVDSSTSQPQPLDASSLERLAQKLESFLIKHGLDLPPGPSASTEPKFQSIRHLGFTIQLDGLAHLACERKSNEKYLDLEFHLQRRRKIYEDVVTNSNSQTKIFRTGMLLSVSGWFKCPKTHCDYFFDGFANKEDRDKHINQHERPFRCSFEECPYAKLGYGTETELKRHKKKSHPTDESSEWTFPAYKPKKDLDFFSASRTGDLTTVQRLVQEGTDVNHTISTRGGRNALTLAAKNNHHDVVKYLLEQRCSRFIILKSIDSAMPFCSISILQMLLDARKRYIDFPERAQKALLTAAKCGREEVLPLLLTYGIDINYRYGKVTTALTHARRRGHHSFAQSLIEHGAIDDKSEPELKLPPILTPATPFEPHNVTSSDESSWDPEYTIINGTFDFDSFLKDHSELADNQLDPSAPHDQAP